MDSFLLVLINIEALCAAPPAQPEPNATELPSCRPPLVAGRGPNSKPRKEHPEQVLIGQFGENQNIWHFDPHMGVGFGHVAPPAAAASLVSVPAASNSTAHRASSTVDGKALPFRRCFISSSSLWNLSPTSKRVRLNYRLHSSSTTKQIDVG